MKATEEQLKYLDQLRERGSVNMFGASPYVAARFGLTRTEAMEVVTEWMEAFEERRPNG